MIVAEGHPIDRKLVEEQLESPRGRIAELRRFFPEEPTCTNVWSSGNGASGAMDLLAAIEPDSNEIRDLARFVCTSQVALFTWERRPERDRWRLLDRERRIVGPQVPEAFKAKRWVHAFWLAWTLRDAEALALLVQVSADRTVEWEKYDRPLVQALQGLFTQDPRTGSYLVQALELADPDKVTRTGHGWVLDFLVPMIACLVPLADRDQTAFETALTKLLELRRGSYVRKRANGASGAAENISVPALGLIAWARTLGMTVEVRCPYTPAIFLDIDEPRVTACPECMTPMTQECRACGRRGDQGVRTFEFRAWFELSREPCRACGHRFPSIATKCPVCSTPCSPAAES